MELSDFLNNKQTVLGKEINVNALIYITAGDKALNEDNYNLAIIKYTNAIELDPNNYYPFMKRGKCFQIIQEYNKAIQDLLNSIKLNSDFENNQTIAECYLFKNEFIDAIEYFQSAIIKIERIEEIDTHSMSGWDYSATKARTFNNLSVCFFKSNQLEKAIESSTKGINANPNYPNNYSIRGMVYLQKGEKLKAKNDLQMAVSLGDSRSQMILNQFGL
jgi:tetratricopeptide (TPR) repeat protein